MTTVVHDLAIDVRRADKLYRGRLLGKARVHALRGVDLRVQRGSVFGLLGPNGAGKSTLVKILLTVIRATRCEGTVLGNPIGDKPTLARVGYLPEHHRFPDYLSAGQVLDYFGALAGVARADRRKRAGELLELVGIAAWKDHKVKGFSKGMRQRLGIANALINDPELVILDEPTDGVDPVGRRDIREVLLALKERGKTVMLNSHLLSELEMVCDRVAIMVQGLVRSQGTIDELTKDSRRYELEVTNPGGVGNARFLPDALRSYALLDAPPPTDGPAPMISATSAATLKGRLPSGVPLLIDESSVSVATDDPDAVQPLIDLLRARGFTIKAIRPVRESLEDLFMKAVTDPTTGRTLKPGAAADKAGRGGVDEAGREGTR
jgi:ABC-2 type transport system ATP-binding protein